MLYVCGHTHVNVFVPVSLTKIKRVLVESVQRRVTTPEYSMLQAIIFFVFALVNAQSLIMSAQNSSKALKSGRQSGHFQVILLYF